MVNSWLKCDKIVMTNLRLFSHKMHIFDFQMLAGMNIPLTEQKYMIIGV
jgi:hypothetical protein